MGTLRRLDHQEQEVVLQEAERAVLTVEAREQLRPLLSHNGAVLVLLGLLVNARTIDREKIAKIPLEHGESAVMTAIKLQGQIAGLDFAIDAIFEIANFNVEEKDDERLDDTDQQPATGL